MSNLIFDFDGTLADTFPLVVDITYDITHAPRLRPEKIQSLRKLPLLAAARRLGGKPWDIPFLILLTRRAMHARIDEVPAFYGVVAMVKALHEAGHRLLVLSSNREDNVRAFLAARDIEGCFDEIYHCNVFRKSNGIKKILRQKHLAVKDTLYIGNEAADIDAARGTGIRAVAVAWSGQDEQSLTRAQPFELIYQPSELVSLCREKS